MASEQEVLSQALSMPDSASGTHDVGLVQKSQNGDTNGSVAMADDEPGQETEEQALESHEVIELQAFSERKAWIEEKIKFLEKLPPIEVFVGLDAIRACEETVPALPTRAELQEWMLEHDRIEKETEIFDSGDLKKLRQITKEATQRHLSPEDTDLIELTLTTIYELDKLLHLLRDRSENLELLSVRLTWEEQRQGAWADHRKILADIGSFLTTRARWSPAIYEVMVKPEEKSGRRGSIASMASDSSGTSSAGFSRSARFKLAELLSRDAAQFAGRASSLRHGKISGSGKALDKLIDHSRKPVPEELLDEQDRLEEKGINEMENVGKFVMNMVTQWRKADEIYVETMKDQLAAQNLLEEIETARLYHPTARQSASFISRADALVKRLAIRGTPNSIIATFPRPTHPLFPDQVASNETLAQSLSSDVAITSDIISKVDSLAKDYRVSYEAVKEAETLFQTTDNILVSLSSISQRLELGVPTGDEDGSPPDLSSDTCLQATRHAAFLTLLPSILQELEQVNERVASILRSYRTALLNLRRPGIDQSFQENAAAQVEQLHSQNNLATKAAQEVLARAGRLRISRKIWLAMDSALRDLEAIRGEIGEMMERERWKQQANSGAAPLTPETPQAVPPISPSWSEDILRRLETMGTNLSVDVSIPLRSMAGSLETPLHDFLSRTSSGLASRLESVKQMVRLLENIKAQCAAMASVREEVQDLQMRVEDLTIQYDSSIQDILSGLLVAGSVSEAETRLNADAETLRRAVQLFINSLTQRIPFVAQQNSNGSHNTTTFVRRKFSSGNIKLGVPETRMSIELPFALATVDDAVRADSNSYAMALGGDIQNLDFKVSHLHLARMAKELDVALSSATEDMRGVDAELASFKVAFSETGQQEDKVASLQQLSQNFEDHVPKHRSRLSRSLSLIRESLRQVDALPCSRDPHLHDTLVSTRQRAVDDIEIKRNVWSNAASTLKSDISIALMEEIRVAESLRLQQEREAKERRLEDERREAEKLEAERVEAERLEAERIEAERLEEERLEAERIETERLEAERLEADRIESERLEAERLEAERIEAEKLEAERLEAERIEAERVRAEKAEAERIEAEKAEAERIEAERVQAERAEVLRIEAEKLEADKREEERREMERREAEKLERERAEVERIRLERIEQENAEKAHLERKVVDKEGLPFATPFATPAPSNRTDEDVFGLRLAPSSPSPTKGSDKNDLLARIISLRKRLRSISINELARPSGSSSSSSQLPSRDQYEKMNARFTSLLADAAMLPSSAILPSVETELRSLRMEVEASTDMMERIRLMAELSDSAHRCDMALSDLLEHIDSYPSPPAGPLSSTHVSVSRLPPEEQLNSRLAFTRRTVTDVTSKLAPINDDPRAVAEHRRILQTWSELEEMGNDRVNDKKSRPSSVMSSGRNSSLSAVSSRSVINNGHSRKSSAYSGLSLKPSAGGRFLSPSHPSTRRAVSGSSDTNSRSSSKLSMLSTASNRSVSGPMAAASPSSSIYSSTFASRQRTSSLSSTASPTPVKRPLPTVRPRAQTRSRASPTPSNASTNAHSAAGHSRSSSSMSTWARAPRQSFPTASKISTPPKKTQTVPKKTYVANPKIKLDVAVGDVVNKLPVNISIEVVADTWKDQSGKYWIGDQEPKLCFCRILRSQTVMVRIGGGWQELSKFIKGHFADLFRIMPPESPPRYGSPRFGSREEKWISSATLLEAPEIIATPPPRTPEPRGPFVPLFTLSTPSWNSPHSVKSSPSSGSPLAPLQFMRRADVDPNTLRPVTPSKTPTQRPRSSVPSTPARHSLWRP
ncbi:hypothetical protein BJ138DRAFT_1053407 [Hygrophoropsis aurantiaca]|uniref:Uncharacterized protein n=1 Tax=Hygrophoropsis aurantiaca TaxID=72124 RepID=A0ACB8ARL4_9AGAM|nr:hypothetical protein BJ138DRAFT_1053407 [Hygrophoropsis aurantiaca]